MTSLFLSRINQQPWLANSKIDGLYIILPHYLAVILLLFLPSDAYQHQTPLWAWVVLVMAIDVGHVYSSYFRILGIRAERQQHGRKMWTIMGVSLVCGVGIYSFSDLWFWRVMAYLAAFHFVRQQYGFFKLYARYEAVTPYNQLLEYAAIYGACLVPLIFWHTTDNRQFQWFIQGDFFSFHYPIVGFWVILFYAIIILLYFAHQIKHYLVYQKINLPKNLILLGTILSWFVGIVWLNGDLSFTLTNVVAHGIPYMALIWIYGKKQPDSQSFFKSSGALWFFLAGLIILGYIEEGLWDGLVWRERGSIFGIFYLPNWDSIKPWLPLIVPVLVLPQVTHYVLDGFIWRMRKNKLSF